MKKYAGPALLILCAFIWGTAFVAQADVAQSIPPFTFNALRAFVGAAALGIFIGGKQVFKRRTANREKEKANTKKLLIAGLICGLVLTVGMNLQQVGITVYPAHVNNIPGRSGFITALYVVLVPIGGLFFKRRVHPLVWLAVALALISLWLLCLKDGFGSIYLGDVLMLICAFAFSVHIITVDTLGSQVDGIKLSCIQFAVAGTLSAVIALFAESGVSLSKITAAWLPILYVGVLSTGVAYTLQIIGQKRTEPAVASILMSLESVFAVLGGWVVFSQALSGREMLGCGCMFAAVLLAQLPQFLERKKQ